MSRGLMLGRIWLCGQLVGTYCFCELLGRFITLLAAFTLIVPEIEACRYSVRDVGFADLGNERYTFRCFVDAPGQDQSSNRFSQAARALLDDSNVKFELVKRNQESEVGVLISPDGKRKHNIALPISKTKTDQLEWSVIQSVIGSPVRDELIKKLISNFAVVLLVEGSDQIQNKRAQLAAVEAIEAITKLMPKMPKPVDNPPVLLKLSIEQSLAESVLLWSLGMDTKTTPEPQALVLMGRGRRVGEMLRGGLITRTALQEALAVIGQDCECGLDRVWMQGERFPLAWGQPEKKAAFAELGFDPDNPKVKAEISRIITRGPNSRPSGNTQSASDNFDQLALGYSEDIIGIDEEVVSIESIASTEPELNQEKISTDGQVAEETVGFGPLFWTVILVIIVTLGGGGLVLLRNKN
ncbi:MAG: hypothetical protein VYB35_13125 [Verrucomicrobiota bacterium]|nr:hypothetical protein [Verrucomicrobiota bacterium]